MLSVVCCMRCPLPVPGCLLCGFLCGICCMSQAAGVYFLPACFPFRAVFATLSVVSCMLPVARCKLRHMSWLFAACCTKSGACCALRDARCLICVACFSLHAACCAACRCCSLRGACCLLRIAGRLLFAVYCPLHGACRLDVVCCIMRVVCCISPVARCMLRGVCCTVSCGALHVVPCVSSAHAVRWIVSNARCLLFVFGCPPQCPVSHVRCQVPRMHLVTLHGLRCESSVACCRPHVPSRIVSLVCCLSYLACRMLHVAKRAFSVASCLLSVADPILACRLLHVVCCNVAERHSAVAYAAHRGGASQLSASVAGKTRYRPRRACVRACVHVGG
jgi:hypothetical protein